MNQQTIIRLIVFFGGIFLSNILLAQSLYSGQHTDKLHIETCVPVKVSAFNLQDVKLLDSPFKENQDREIDWLLSLKNDQLLYSFRINAGMDSRLNIWKDTSFKPFGGWEALDVELRGHTLGHVLSGLALMYASTGEAVFKLKADSLVSELAEIQEVLNQGGYLSAFPQNLINRAIAGESVWAPWYTLHKIYAGLLDMYLYTDNKLALQVAEKMGMWAFDKLSTLNQEQLDIMLKCEFGGTSETFYNLYAITGKKEFLAVAKMFYHKEVLDPLAEGRDILKSYHANTYIPKIIGEVRGYELTGKDKKKDIADFFWNTVINHHTYAIGGNSNNEHFFAPDSLSKNLSPTCSETCNTYNMLKLTSHLFTLSSDAKYADYYEQALYNHILGSQDPETGMVCYYMPFKAGLFKVYSTPENSFWCCVGTGFENHAKYGEAIYFHNERDIYVNLFIPSELNWKEKGIKISQETMFPEEEKTRIAVLSGNGEKFKIYLRYPSWATSGVTVEINGKRQKIRTQPGNYIVLDRNWNDSDVIEVNYPMTLRLIKTPDNPNIAAIAYGPIVLAGATGDEGITNPAPYAQGHPSESSDYKVPDNVENSIITHNKKINDWIKPIDGTKPLTFSTTGARSEYIKLIPYYKMHHQRYVIYWNLIKEMN